MSSLREHQEDIVRRARDALQSSHAKGVQFRKKQLQGFLNMIKDNKDAIIDAIKKDLGKPPFETSLHEILMIENEITELMGLVGQYVEPERKSKGVMTLFDQVYVLREPLGLVLILGAWNYPALLSLSPVAGAIAAGNACILKPSEHSPHFAKLIEKLFSEYLDSDWYNVVNCDVPGTTDLLKNKFDLIFYTGGKNGAKFVYDAAAKQLTPVVLELGGKSPVYIDEKICHKEELWLRLFWGKFINSGQTCIAPDYVLCTAKTQAQARKYFVKIIEKFYAKGAKESPDFSRIVNSDHFERIKRLIKSCRLVLGGTMHPGTLCIEPAIVTDVTMDEPIMQEEIFGPILPFVTVKNESEAIQLINSRPKPLALYVFSESNDVVHKFSNKTSSGAMLVNDTILHIAVASLPFGGVGESGIGKYHGKYSFDVFSNQKAVLKRNFNPMLEWLGSHRYPPYTSFKHTVVQQLMMHRRLGITSSMVTHTLALMTGAACLAVYNNLLS